MGSSVSVYTYAHSVTYVTDKILSSIKRIILGLNLNPSSFTNDYAVLERGITSWLNSKHLEEAVLEVKNSAGLVTRFDFTIDYSYSTGDGDMWIDVDAIKFSIVKQGIKPNECSYNIKVSLKSGAPDVSGWSSCDFLSTAGYVKQSLGTTIGTNAIGTQTGYWRKS